VTKKLKKIMVRYDSTKMEIYKISDITGIWTCFSAFGRIGFRVEIARILLAIQW
jgi:hypothetical protein